MKDTLDYLEKDKYGNYIDLSGVETAQLIKSEVLDTLTVFFIFNKKERFYNLPLYIKMVGKKTTAGEIARKVNKILPGSAIRVALFSSVKTYYVTEQGLHLATDFLLKSNELKLGI